MHEKYEKKYKCILDHHWANKVEKKNPKKCQKLAGNSLLITALWCLSLLTAKQQNMQTHDRADGMGEGHRRDIPPFPSFVMIDLEGDNFFHK